jgi:hypothetical protein
VTSEVRGKPSLLDSVRPLSAWWLRVVSTEPDPFFRLSANLSTAVVLAMPLRYIRVPQPGGTSRGNHRHREGRDPAATAALHRFERAHDADRCCGVLADVLRATCSPDARTTAAHPRSRDRVHWMAGAVRGASAARGEWTTPIGIAYGVLLVIVGLTTGVLRSAQLPRGGQAEGLLYVALVDMLLFASFFGAAIRFRRRPDVHKKLMTVAATALLVAAAGRMSFLPAPPAGLAGMYLVWSSPVLLAVVYDLRHIRAVHPVYVAGLVAFAFRVWSEPLALTSTWSAFATLVFRSASSL